MGSFRERDLQPAVDLLGVKADLSHQLESLATQNNPRSFSRQTGLVCKVKVSVKSILECPVDKIVLLVVEEEGSKGTQ